VVDELTPDQRKEIVDWIVFERTGLHGDNRGPALEALCPYTGAAFVMNAKEMRGQLQAMDDHTLRAEGIKELKNHAERNARFRAGLALLEEKERQDELDRQEAYRKEFARRGGSASKKLIGLVEACKALRSSGIRSVKQALRELQRGSFKTADGRFEVHADSDGIVHQLDNCTGKTDTINGDSFRTGYWSKVKSY
jgi:hypothetical protein